MIKSKFSFAQVYLLGAFLVAVLAAGIYLLYHSEIQFRTKLNTTMDAGYVSLLFFVVVGFGVYQLWSKLKTVIIEPDAIIIKSIFKTEVLVKENIASIDLFARKSVGFLSNNRNVNGIKIAIKQNQSYFFADQYYSNIAAVKEAIANHFKQLISEQVKNTNNSIANTYKYAGTEVEKFSGNFIISVNGITIITCYSVPFILFKQEGNKFLLLMTCLMTLFLLIPFAFKSHYFLLSNNQLLVKNQFWWWKNKVFDLDNIESVIVENGYRQSTALRINTKDFHSKKFQAGSLRDNTWKKLISSLKAAGIPVQNDSYIS